MQRALSALRLLAEGRQTVEVEEVAALLGVGLFDAKMWCLEADGSPNRISAQALVAQLQWVPLAEALESLPLSMGSAVRQRSVCFAYDHTPYQFVHLLDLLLIVGRRRGTLQCLQPLMSEQPSTDPQTGRRVSWRVPSTSRNSFSSLRGSLRKLIQAL